MERFRGRHLVWGTLVIALVAFGLSLQGAPVGDDAVAPRGTVEATPTAAVPRDAELNDLMPRYTTGDVALVHGAKADAARARVVHMPTTNTFSSGAEYLADPSIVYLTGARASAEVQVAACNFDWVWEGQCAGTAQFEWNWEQECDILGDLTFPELAALLPLLEGHVEEDGTCCANDCGAPIRCGEDEAEAHSILELASESNAFSVHFEHPWLEAFSRREDPLCMFACCYTWCCEGIWLNTAACALGAGRSAVTVPFELPSASRVAVEVTGTKECPHLGGASECAGLQVVINEISPIPGRVAELCKPGEQQVALPMGTYEFEARSLAKLLTNADGCMVDYTASCQDDLTVRVDVNPFGCLECPGWDDHCCGLPIAPMPTLGWNCPITAAAGGSRCA